MTWWSSTWMHYEKRFVSQSDFQTTLEDGTKVFLIHAKKGYQKHVSVKRLLYCRRMGKLFRKRINKFDEKPDLIICSWPLIELAYESIRYAKRNNIPVIIDIRDLWPEIFIQPFKGIKQLIAKAGVKLLYNFKVKYAVKNAYQIIGVTKDAVDLSYRWGRKANSIDHPLFLSCLRKEYDEESKDFAMRKWESFGIKDGDKIFVYVGSIHLRNAKLDLIIQVAKQLPNIKFVFCGKGPDYDALVNDSKGFENIVFPGYMNELELSVLERIATCGILPYSNTPDFINALPNKLGEYLSNGLPVLTHLKGDSRTILEAHSCGSYFSNCTELKQLVLRYSMDNDLLSSSKNNALSLFGEYFNADVVYADFIDTFKTLFSNGG